MQTILMQYCLLYTIILITIIIPFIHSQTCLSSPPEIEWTFINGIYTSSISFDVETFYSFDGYPTTFTTRVHNGQIPSPTLRFKRNQSYHLTLYNNLGEESKNNPTAHNVIKDLNTTNVCTYTILNYSLSSILQSLCK